MKHVRSVLYEQGKNGSTAWVLQGESAQMISTHLMITVEYMLGTWVLKISPGLDSKFCHLLLCDLEHFT